MIAPSTEDLGIAGRSALEATMGLASLDTSAPCPLSGVSMNELAEHIVEVIEVYASVVSGARGHSTPSTSPTRRNARLSTALTRLVGAWDSSPTEFEVTGRRTSRHEVGWVIVCELLGHTHDLMRGGLPPVSVPTAVLDLAARAEAEAGKFVDAYRHRGTVGPEQLPPTDANSLESLAAFFGRRIPE